MTNFKTDRMRRFLAVPLLILLLILAFTPSVSEASNADCEKGLVKCVSSAVLGGIANPAFGIAMIGFCLNGYAFCLEFLQDQRRYEVLRTKIKQRVISLLIIFFVAFFAFKSADRVEAVTMEECHEAFEECMFKHYWMLGIQYAYCFPGYFFCIVYL